LKKPTIFRLVTPILRSGAKDSRSWWSCIEGGRLLVRCSSENKQRKNWHTVGPWSIGTQVTTYIYIY
jgi:hypothetical protein